MLVQWTQMLAKFVCVMHKPQSSEYLDNLLHNIYNPFIIQNRRGYNGKCSLSFL
jgi:hypothetical protein